MFKRVIANMLAKLIFKYADKPFKIGDKTVLIGSNIIHVGRSTANGYAYEAGLILENANPSGYNSPGIQFQFQYNPNLRALILQQAGEMLAFMLSDDGGQTWQSGLLVKKNEVSTRHLLPIGTDQYDIGSSSQKFKNMYLSGKADVNTVKLAEKTADPTLEKGLIWFRSDEAHLYYSPDGSAKRVIDTPSKADVIVFKHDNKAIAINNKTKEKIAESEDHPTLFQNLIDNLEAKGGGTILVLRGTYSITSAIKFGSNIHLIGEEGTVFRRDADINNMIRNKNLGASGYDGVQNIKVEGITFDVQGDTYTTNCTAVGFAHAKHVTIRGCKFINHTDSWHPLELNAVRYGRIEDNVIIGHETEVRAKSAMDIDAANNYNAFAFDDFNPDGTGCKDIIIRNNIIINCKRGIVLHKDEDERVTVEGNIIIGACLQGIMVFGKKHKIKNNTIADAKTPTESATYAAIRISKYTSGSDAGWHIIEGNVIHNYATDSFDGIHVDGKGSGDEVQNIIIKNNIIRNVGGYGIYLNYLVGARVKDNVIKEATSGTIYQGNITDVIISDNIT